MRWHPAVFFEVLSETTARTDLVTKNREDAATVFERKGGDWVGHLCAADSIPRMPEIGVEVPLANYRREATCRWPRQAHKKPTDGP